MPRTCVFCGASPTTREHVWPASAAPLLAAEGPLPHFQQVVQEGREGVERSWPQDAYSVATRVVCAGCNNGWMANLESEAKPMLAPMLHERGRVLHGGGQRTLAAWALKTRDDGGAHARRCATRHFCRRVPTPLRTRGAVRPPPHLDGQLRRRRCRNGPHVWLDADMTLDPDPDRGRRDIWGATITFGPAVFQLFGTSVPWLLDGVEVRAPGSHRLWPYERSFTWAPRPGLNDHELVHFADGLVNTLSRHSHTVTSHP